jgi:CrcB protein
MNVPPVIWVAVGGALGSAARYGVSVAFDTTVAGRTFPWATFLVNLVGSAVLAVVAVLVSYLGERDFAFVYHLLGVGLCGGFTTFSTFERDAFRLLEQDRFSAAGLYMLGSVLAGFGCYLAAHVMMRYICPPPG